MRIPAPASRSTRLLLTGFAWFLVAVASLAAQAPGGTGERTAKELYDANCATCHGADGTGAPKSTLGYDSPPDFTVCSFATVEPDSDWFAVSHDGGPARAFDRRMPAFGETLTEDEIMRAMKYLRAFCKDPSWPRGELNMPRPFRTEKAFPENETVFTNTITTGDDKSVGTTIVYEQRFGARNQFEVVIPLDLKESGGGWRRGLGDLKVAVKRALFHSLAHGAIFSAAAELILPTGKEQLGLGKGVTIFEPFVAFGKLLPADSFIQVQVGAELPFDRSIASNEGLWRAAAGKTFTEGRFGRAWTPMIELVGARELKSGEKTQWDIVPQLQVSLSRRQHILLNVGVQLPANEREGRHARVLTYLLWDWFDGGFFEGWH